MIKIQPEIDSPVSQLSSSDVSDFPLSKEQEVTRLAKILKGLPLKNEPEYKKTITLCTKQLEVLKGLSESGQEWSSENTAELGRLTQKIHAVQETMMVITRKSLEPSVTIQFSSFRNSHHRL